MKVVTSKNWRTTTLLFCLATITAAQQPLNWTHYIPQGSISDACYQVINQTRVSCPYSILYGAWDNYARLPKDAFPDACNIDCINDLVAVRDKIADVCSRSDSHELDGSSYPATYLADLYIHSYNVTCRKDRNGEYCDARNSSAPCDECELGLGSMLLNSPLTYHSDIESEFNAATSSCGASTYEWSKPTMYAYSTSVMPTWTAPSTPIASRACERQYKVQPGDTCDSIAIQQNVSTFSVIDLNGLDIWCTYLPETVCLTAPCKTYTWRPRDNCWMVAWNTGITEAQLRAWNPVINEMCGNLARVNGSQVCVSPPGRADLSSFPTGNSSTQSDPGGSTSSSGISLNSVDMSVSTDLSADTADVTTVVVTFVETVTATEGTTDTISTITEVASTIQIGQAMVTSNMNLAFPLRNAAQLFKA